MAWYRTGTVTVFNGSAAVVGAGTDFVSNATMGDGFRGPDGRVYEIARVVSATELTLAEVYASGSAGGQSFAIQPTQSYLRDLAQSAATLLATFGAVRDGIGQGLIGDGTPAAPGIRFLADPDTGIARFGANLLSLVAGGSEVVRAGVAQVVSIAPLAAQDGATMSRAAAAGATVYPLDIFANAGGTATVRMRFGTAANQVATNSYIEAQTLTASASDLRFGTSGQERARIDSSGNLLVGVSPENQHTFAKNVAQGQPVLMAKTTGASGQPSFVACGVVSYTPSGAGAAVYFGHHSASGRSINAGGTINASGADYAEYMTKAAGCGTIAAGDVCGVDIDGKLTRTWADARSFVVKSTDPAYVGGDIWAADLPPRPDAPGAEPIEPTAPPAKPEDEAAQDTWRAIVDAYPAALSAWRTAHAEWQAATTAYERDLPVWEAALEAERVKVDRIAFCGQVPVNVTGEFAVGDYLIAAAAGAGIKAVAIAAAEITFEQYRRRLGKVWAVRDGRAWVDVQHG